MEVGVVMVMDVVAVMKTMGMMTMGRGARQSGPEKDYPCEGHHEHIQD